MLVAGIYNRGVKFLFRIIVGNFRKEILLLPPKSTEETSDSADRLNVMALTGKLAKDIEKTILCHAIVDVTGNISQYMGDIQLLEAFLKDASNTDLMELVYRKDPCDNFVAEIPGGYITVLANNTRYNTVAKRRGLAYKTIAKEESIQTYVKTGCVRSMSELRQIYNLDWALNPDGSFKKDYHTVTTLEGLSEVEEQLIKHKLISFDIESTGVDFFYRGNNEIPSKEKDDCRIVGFGLSWKANSGYYIPLESAKFECLDANVVIPRIFPILAKKKLIGTNLPFDIRGSYSYGYMLRCHFDVMQAEFLLDPTGSRGHKKLKELSRYYLGEEAPELDEVLGGPVDGRLIPQLDKDVITLYGCSDVDTAFRIHEIQKKLLGPRKVAFKLDMKMSHIVAIQDYYGLRVDMELFHALNEINQRDLAQVECACRTYLREKVIWDIASTLIKESGVEPTEDYIQEVISSHPEISSMAEELLIVYTDKKQKVKRELNFASSKDISYIFHKLLKYPIIKNRQGNNSHDDMYLQRLIHVKAKQPTNFLASDITSVITEYNFDWLYDGDEEIMLINKDELNSTLYPFALLLQQWRKLTKRQTSFLNVIQSTEVDAWYNTTTSMTAADTARFINSAQTLQGYFKRLIRSYSDEHYFLSFDLAQIEFRVMIGLAVNYWKEYVKNLPQTKEFDVLREIDISYLIDRLNIPWADYHREGGSALVGTTPAKMTKEERNNVKPPHFAIPYGGEAYTIARDLLVTVNSETERQKVIDGIEVILSAWRKTMFPLYKFLEQKRDIALQPVSDDLLPPKLKGGRWGAVTNALGRIRYYNLDYSEIAKNIAIKDNQIEMWLDKDLEWREHLQRVTRRVQGNIRRSAGNYPIQSLAREFFAIMISKLFEYCYSKGYSGTGSFETDVIISSLMIHDENHIQVRKVIHPFKMYGIIMKTMMLDFEGFPKMYLGINVMDNWYEGKDDKYEAPVEFVNDMVKAYNENPDKFDNEDWKTSTKQYVLRYLTQWIHTYTAKFLRENTVDNVFDLVKFRQTNENYFVFTKVGLYTPKFKNKEKDITPQELVLLYHNDNPNLIVKTESRTITFSEYVFEMNTVKEKQSSESTNHFTESSTDFGELDLFSDEIDDMDAFEVCFDDDMPRKELEATNLYWLASEAERTFNQEAEYITGYEGMAKDKSDEPPEQPVFADMVLLNSTWIINISKLTTSVVKSLVAYLKRYLDPNGYPILWKAPDGPKMSSQKLSNNVDLDIVKCIMTQKI